MVDYFMTKMIGVPFFVPAMFRLMRATWSKLSAVGPTIRYDARIMGGDFEVPVDELAMLAAEISEAAEVGDHRQVRRLRGDLLGRDLTGRSGLDQAAQHPHVGAQVVVNLLEVQPGRALRRRHVAELRRVRARRVVEKDDVIDHASRDNGCAAPIKRERCSNRGGQACSTTTAVP